MISPGGGEPLLRAPREDVAGRVEAAAWAFQYTIAEFEADPDNPDHNYPKIDVHALTVRRSAFIQTVRQYEPRDPADCQQKGYMLANKADMITATAFMTPWIKAHDRALEKAKE